MKAQNLTVSVPYKGCNKMCPYCVSKMTGLVESDEVLFRCNMKKALTIAKAANVSSVLITGKGEPFLNESVVKFVCDNFVDYPIEIQTNGIILKNCYYSRLAKLDFLQQRINVVAFSIDCIEYWKTLGDLFRYLETLGIVVRVTLNVTDDMSECSFGQLINIARSTNTRQLSLRNILVPDRVCGTPECDKAIEWVMDNTSKRVYEKLVEEFEDVYKDPHDIIRSLPFGAEVFDIDGIAFTYFDECLQETNNSLDIRSLIYQEDGHMYTSWDSPASILF